MSQRFSSPAGGDTQAFPASQFVDAHGALSEEVEDEVKEGVWGYLFPVNPQQNGRCIVLKKRSACPLPDDVSGVKTVDVNGGNSLEREESFEKSRIPNVPSGGYLIGRHPECGKTSATAKLKSPLRVQVS